MLRSPYLVAVAIALLGGCSSTLNEYHCESSLDCIGEMVGRCEASGHCSFVDSACESGFRFGDNAGSESDVCVGADSDAPDASTVDPPADAGTSDATSSTAPIANIKDLTFDCNKTNEVFDGAASQAFGVRTLIDFEWTLLKEGQVLDKFGRAPGDTLWHAIHRLGGTYARPRINLPSYHNRKAIQVNVVTPTAMGGEKLVQTLSTTGSLGSVRVSFVIGKEGPGSSSGTFRLLDSAGAPLATDATSIDFGLDEQVVTFNPGGASISQPLSVEFAFNAAGQYWVDNLSAVNLNNGDDIAKNGSVEFGSLDWALETDTTSASAQVEDIPASLRQNGKYKIELRVTDSEDLVSAPDSVEITVADCP